MAFGMDVHMQMFLPDVEHLFFHCLCHSEEWKGLQKRYETEAEFALQMRLLSALASVPAYNVALSKIVNYGLPSWQY